MLLSDFYSRQMRPDVRLHMRQLIGQDVADHLHRHPIARHLLPHSQSPAGGDRALRSMLKLFFFGSAVKLFVRLYLSSLMLHMMSSFQLTKIMATSFSVSSSQSSSGLWKI